MRDRTLWDNKLPGQEIAGQQNSWTRNCGTIFAGYDFFGTIFAGQYFLDIICGTGLRDNIWGKIFAGQYLLDDIFLTEFARQYLRDRNLTFRRCNTCVSFGHCVSQLASHSKVRQFGMPLNIQKNISSFDITMYFLP